MKYLEIQNAESRAIIVVCAANLTASDKCPHDCFNCWCGGNFTIHWNLNGQGYVQHYSSRESILTDFEALKDQWLSEGEDHIKAKMEALKTWLDSDMGKVESGSMKTCYGNMPLKTDKKECETCSVASGCVRESLDRDVKRGLS